MCESVELLLRNHSRMHEKGKCCGLSLIVMLGAPVEESKF